MTLCLDHASVDDVVWSDELAARLAAGEHVILRFARLGGADRDLVVARFGDAVRDCRVFRSGEHQLTIVPVVATSRVHAHAGEIRAAIADYRATCAALVEAHGRDALPGGWQVYEHGEHARFVHAETHQVVEAVLDGDAAQVDPFFFAEFVRSTPHHAGVAGLIVHAFHDAARMLDVLGERGLESA